MTYAAKRRFPKHLCSTEKQWRQLKRQQWREVVKALETYTIGSAFAPGGNNLHEIIRLVSTISEDMDEDWIAW